MQTIVDGIITNYEKFDNPVGEMNIVILHGWGGSVDEWVHVAKQLSKLAIVYLIDLPGFGKTLRSNETMDTYAYAEYVKSFIKKFKIHKPVLVGHSFGGRIGIILGSQDNIIDKLILVASAGIEKKTSRQKPLIYYLR